MRTRRRRTSDPLSEVDGILCQWLIPFSKKLDCELAIHLHVLICAPEHYLIWSRLSRAAYVTTVMYSGKKRSTIVAPKIHS